MVARKEKPTALGLGGVRAAWAGRFALQVFDGSRKKGRGGGVEGDSCREGENVAGRGGVWHDLPAGKENRSE